MAKAKARKSSLPKLIERYYADLAEFASQNVLFEMGTRHAFHRLMADAGKEYRWTLIAEQEKKIGGKTIRPDGTFKDDLFLVRGYWEAKDTADKLDAEIEQAPPRLQAGLRRTFSDCARSSILGARYSGIRTYPVSSVCGIYTAHARNGIDHCPGV